MRALAHANTRNLTLSHSGQKMAYTALAHFVEFVCGSGIWEIFEDALFSKILLEIEPPLHKVVQWSILDVKLSGTSKHAKRKRKGKKDEEEEEGEKVPSVVSLPIKYKALKGKYLNNLWYFFSHVIL